MSDSSQKSIIVSAVFFFVVILFFGVGYFYYQRSLIAAVVDGEKIPKSEYEERKEKEKKFLDFAFEEDEKVEKISSLPKDTINKMIEEKILSQVSEEKNIAVLDDEISEKENRIINSYEDEDEYKEILDKVYGQEREDVRESLKNRILRDKISKEFVDKRSVSFVYVRYDSTGQENNPEVNVDGLEELAQQKANEYLKLAEEEGFESLKDQAQEEKNNNQLFLGVSEYKMIDREIALSEEDKEAIWSLDLNKFSNLVKSPGGFYAIYYLEEKMGGEYGDYESFLQQQRKEKRVKIYLPEAAGKTGFIEELQTIFVGVSEAASCKSCATAKGVNWNGYITDAVTGNKLSGVSLKAESTGSGSQCSGYTTKHHGWCGPKSGTTTSDTDGYYQFGPVDGNNAFPNCGWGDKAAWKLTASKAGYNTYSGDHKIAGYNGAVYQFNIELTASSWDELSVTLSCKPDELEVDYYTDKSVSCTATVDHNRGPDVHGMDKYEWDFTGDGNYDRTTDSNTAVFYYGWIDSEEKKIDIKVRATCAKGKEAEATDSLILKRPEHKIVCKTLRAEPKSGVIPLSVNFIAEVIDTWGYPITKYEWDFDGNGTWNRETSTNITDYTYSTKGSFAPLVRGSNQYNVPSECPASARINSELWSESDWLEIAP